MTRPVWAGWMQAPTLAGYDAEDAAQREDEALTWGEFIKDGVGYREPEWWELEFPGWDWTPGSLKRVDEYIEGDVIWP